MEESPRKYQVQKEEFADIEKAEELPQPGQTAAGTEEREYYPHVVYPSWIGCAIVGAFVGFATFLLMMFLLAAEADIGCAGLVAIGACFLVASIVVMAACGYVLARKAIQQVTTLDEVEPTSHKVGRYGCIACSVFFYIIMCMICIVGAAFYAMKQSVPDYERDYEELDGLDGTVTITREANGFPHIEANSRRDAAFGQGFVQAQDRLFQIEFFRLLSQGRLSEHVGDGALDVDKVIRAMNFGPAARAMCRLADPDVIDALNGYTKGVNTFLKKATSHPPEFYFMNKEGTPLIPHEPEEFHNEDFCQTAMLVIFQLCSNYEYEMDRWDLFNLGGLSYDEIVDLYPDYTNTSSILTPQQMGTTEAAAVSARAREAASHAAERVSYNDVMWRFKDKESASTAAGAAAARSKRRSTLRALFKAGSGSNAWAARAANKMPIGTSDPHLDITTPSIWHPVHISFPGVDAIGVTVPSLPGVLIGRNRNVSWGITLTISDSVDFLFMIPDPDRPETHYMYRGESLPYEVRTEKIKVMGGKDKEIKMYNTVLGPVVGEEFELSTKHRVVMNCTSFLPDPAPMNAFLNIHTDKVRTVHDLYNALSTIPSPTLSIAMADDSGNIGWMVTGRHPIRAQGHTGRFPSIGDGRYDVQGYIPLNELPKRFDSATNQQGHVACSNQKIYPDGYMYSLGFDWEPNYRGRRINDVLGAATAEQLASVQFHQDLQHDTTSGLWVYDYLPYFQNTVFQSKFRAALTVKGAAWLDRLLAWDGKSSMGAQEPSFLWQWNYEVGKLPKKVREVIECEAWEIRSYPQRVLFNPSPIMETMCAEQTSGGTCFDYVTKKFNEVADRKDKSWGKDLNKLHINHPLFGETFLGCMFNKETDKDGDYCSVNVAGIVPDKVEKDLFVDHAASMRQIYDWSSPWKYWFSFPTGVSGNPFSKWYDNFMDLYSRDEHVEVLLRGFTGKQQQLKP